MATKRSIPLDDPPAASSDDEETEDEQEQHVITHKANAESLSSEEEEEEESDEETIGAVKNPYGKPTIQNPNSKTGESSSEEESESDSEEETPTPLKTSIVKRQTLPTKSSSTLDSNSELRTPTASDFAIIPSKKINALPAPEKIPISKRPSSESDVKDKKKVKLSNGDADDEKKSVNKRVWSDDDEILLLQGFIDYQSIKGCSPLSDMDGFYQFTMDSLPGNATKSQLYEKIRRLKKKFRVNSEKASSNGEDPVFPKPHERKLFEVSKKIWGINGCESVSASAAAGGSNPKPKTKPVKVIPKIEVKEEDEDDKTTIAKVEDFETLYPYWNVALNSECSSSFRFPTGVVALIKENLSLIGEAKAKEMNEKWEAVFENEAVLRRRRIALLSSVNDVETTSLGK
ncbi:STOREKEEPER protein [Lactuca sativa]|uniref:Glabrous enhancer-binding protein-like DBD domain-containing protein n=1 Tax=Lactuca sativa TaxID=4236 RepID=A0A9R1W686_LACSA|nr:STOREKEEPER protein [Lactuca sativa]KAJ0217908.1 hypothetical protein LSAT_V11C300118900 [Lactuca sativa]